MPARELTVRDMALLAADARGAVPQPEVVSAMRASGFERVESLDAPGGKGYRGRIWIDERNKVAVVANAGIDDSRDTAMMALLVETSRTPLGTAARIAEKSINTGLLVAGKSALTSAEAKLAPMLDEGTATWGKRIGVLKSSGYRVITTGYGIGGAFAQLQNQALGTEGVTFDAPGAANLAASDVFGRAVRPVAPDYTVARVPGATTNYILRSKGGASPPDTGPHVGRSVILDLDREVEVPVMQRCGPSPSGSERVERVADGVIDGIATAQRIAKGFGGGAVLGVINAVEEVAGLLGRTGVGQKIGALFSAFGRGLKALAETTIGAVLGHGGRERDSAPGDLAGHGARVLDRTGRHVVLSLDDGREVAVERAAFASPPAVGSAVTLAVGSGGSLVWRAERVMPANGVER